MIKTLDVYQGTCKRRINMRVIVSVLTLLVLTGCATTKAGQDRYALYLKAWQNVQQQKACEIEFEKGQKVTGIRRIVCYRESRQPSPPPPQAPHPGWRVLETAIRVTGNLVGIGLIGNTVADIVEEISHTAGHNTTITVEGSFNTEYGNYSGNSGDGWGNVDNSIHDSYNTDNSIHDSYWTDDHSTSQDVP